MKIKSFALLLFFSVAFVGCKTQSQEDSVGSQQADPHAAHHAGHLPAGLPPDAASVAAARINQTPPPSPAPEGMVWVPGGAFWMGCDDCDMPDALPVHLVTVDGFWMDATPVTNAQFQKFVEATGYKTIAERAPDPKDFPGVPKEKLVAGSAVFDAPDPSAAIRALKDIARKTS